MTIEGFVGYAAEQIAKAKSDKPEVRVERLKHLAEQIEVAKDFEGSPETPGGLLAVKQYKDPDQYKTTEKETSPSNASPTTEFSSNDIPNASSGVGTATAGDTPPIVASGSGFDSPATATFAKAIEKMSGDICELVKALKEEEPKAKKEEESEDSEDESDDEEKDEDSEDAEESDDEEGDDEESDDEESDDEEGDDEAEEVAKSGDVTKGVIWPLNMNSDFGMGRVEKDEPEWGRDNEKSSTVKKTEKPKKPVSA
jgi:hypothetical protein